VTDTQDRVEALRVLARLGRVLEAVDSGLTLPQYRVLAIISHGGVRSALLAERLAVRRPTLTAIADGLVAAGYAARESDPGDRRVVRLHVTDAGRAALRKADDAYLEKLGPIFAETGIDDRLVTDLLAIRDVLDERLRLKVSVPAGRAAEATA
jgi:DNA-binding MarR family transcriptional regulator